MALGTITLVEAAAAQGPLFMDRITVVGDGAYPSGGSATFEALAQVAIGNRTIVGLINDDDNGDFLLQYDHAADKLLVRIISTGAEEATSDQSGRTYKLTVISK